MTVRQMKSGCVPDCRIQHCILMGNIFLFLFANAGKGGVWMEQILKAVVIGVLTAVIAVLNENDKRD